MICEAPELQLEILGHLFEIVDIDTLQSLRANSQVRHLWKRPSGVQLDTGIEKQEQFCKAISDFQVGRLATHPGISFGNITVIYMDLYPQRQLIRDFKTALSFLSIQDLAISCDNIPSFMANAVSIWAPFLQALLILRITFDREMSMVSFALFRIQTNFRNSAISCLRMSLCTHGVGSLGYLPYLFCLDFEHFFSIHRKLFPTNYKRPYEMMTALVSTSYPRMIVPPSLV